MSSRPKQRPAGADRPDRLSHEEFKRLANEAKLRGESTAPLIKRLVLQTIDEVQEQLQDDVSSRMVN